MNHTPILPLEVLRHYSNEAIFHLIESGTSIDAERIAAGRALHRIWIDGAQAAAFRARRGCAGVVVALCALGANAQDFTATEKALYIGMQTATLIDWAQTRDIARNPDRFAEVNPILGKSPSVGRVNAFMVSRLALQHIAVMSMPASYRVPVMATLTAAYTAVAIHNAKTGVRIGGRDAALMVGVAAGAVLGARMNGWAFTPWQVTYTKEF